MPYDINCCSRRRPEYQKQLLQYIEQYGKEQEAQYKITVFQNGMNFMDDYKGDCDLIFMDIAMPHMDGLETAAALRKRRGQHLPYLYHKHGTVCIEGL